MPKCKTSLFLQAIMFAFMLLGDPGGGDLGTHTPFDPVSFIHAVPVQILPNNKFSPFLRSWCPIWEILEPPFSCIA